MICLLIQHPQMLKEPELGLMGKIRLESACEKTESTPDCGIWLIRMNGWNRRDEARHEMLQHIRSNLSEMDEVVREGYELAEHLKGMGGEKWERISKVWVEILCRTAAESRPRAHMRTLSTGSELITLVWLLMNHLGI